MQKYIFFNSVDGVGKYFFISFFLLLTNGEGGG